ncbi:MAG: glycosyltransferase [Paracoccaceae bacterium]
MRIAHFLVGTQDGGAEEFLLNLAAAQAEAGDDVLLIVGPNESRLARIRAAGLDYEVLTFGGVGQDLADRWRLRRILRRFRPHVLQSWMNRAGRRTRRGPYVAIGRLGGYYPVRHYRQCEHLVANTPAILDHVLASGWPEEQAHLITNFTTLTPAPAVGRASLDTPEAARVVLALGRLHQSKGFDRLIDAMATLPEAYVLWLGGAGVEGEALAARARGLGVEARVRFLGWRHDAAALYAAADVYAMTSLDEPLGNVVLEAFAAGLPVVATRSRGPSWIITDGEDGLLVEPEADALARAIRRAVEDRALADRLVSGGRATLEARFSKLAVVRQYRALYERTWHAKFGALELS